MKEKLEAIRQYCELRLEFIEVRSGADVDMKDLLEYIKKLAEDGLKSE